MKLNFSQRKSLAEYFGNLSIAWLAAGVIGPYVTRQGINETQEIVVFSVFMAVLFLIAMLRLEREGRKI